MLGKEDKNWEPFSDLAKIMEHTPQKNPPKNFTFKVMEKLSEKEMTVQSFSLQRLFSTNLNFGFSNLVTKKECAFYFFLTGFFYFILSLIMIIGLPIPAIMQNNSWLSFQPLFGLLLAAELMTIGIVLYTTGDYAVRFVRLGTVLYAALVILNFFIGALSVNVPAAIFFVMFFSITGLGIAFFLRLAIERYSPETIFSEVRG